jgi:hypothetical protein
MYPALRGAFHRVMILSLSFVIKTRLFVEDIAPSAPVCRVDEEIRESDTESEAAEEPEREQAQVVRRTIHFERGDPRLKETAKIPFGRSADSFMDSIFSCKARVRAPK